MILPANSFADSLPERAQDWLWRWLSFGRSPEHRQAIRNAEQAKRFSDALMATLPPPDLMWKAPKPWFSVDTWRPICVDKRGHAFAIGQRYCQYCRSFDELVGKLSPPPTEPD